MNRDIRDEFMAGFNSVMKGGKSTTAYTEGCLLIYMLPAVCACFSSWWATVIAIASIALGLWLSLPSRRWIAAISIACLFYPNVLVKVLGWVCGFLLTIYLDGAYKRNPQPSSEWD
jgi:hypothetical protein